LDENDYDRSQREEQKNARGALESKKKLQRTVIAPQARRLFIESFMHLEANKLYERFIECIGTILLM